MLSAPPADAQWFSSTPTPLAEIEETVAERYDDIAHVGPEDLAKMQGAGEDFILLDVREKREFEVSHIPGAIQIDPDARASDLAARLARRRWARRASSGQSARRCLCLAQSNPPPGKRDRRNRCRPPL